MSIGSIVVLLIIFGWIAFLLFSRIKKRHDAKVALANGDFVCTGGCSGCGGGIPNQSSCCSGATNISFVPQECGAAKTMERLEQFEKECPHCASESEKK